MTRFLLTLNNVSNYNSNELYLSQPLTSLLKTPRKHISWIVLPFTEQMKNFIFQCNAHFRFFESWNTRQLGLNFHSTRNERKSKERKLCMNQTYQAQTKYPKSPTTSGIRSKNKSVERLGTELKSAKVFITGLFVKIIQFLETPPISLHLAQHFDLTQQYLQDLTCGNGILGMSFSLQLIFDHFMKK